MAVSINTSDTSKQWKNAAPLVTFHVQGVLLKQATLATLATRQRLLKVQSRQLHGATGEGKLKQFLRNLLGIHSG